MQGLLPSRLPSCYGSCLSFSRRGAWHTGLMARASGHLDLNVSLGQDAWHWGWDPREGGGLGGFVLWQSGTGPVAHGQPSPLGSVLALYPTGGPALRWKTPCAQATWPRQQPWPPLGHRHEVKLWPGIWVDRSHMPHKQRQRTWAGPWGRGLSGQWLCQAST